MLPRAPIRLRLTLWYLTLLAVILALFGGGVYLFMRQALYENLSDSAYSRAEGLLGVIQFLGQRPVLPGELSQTMPKQEDYFVRLFDDAGVKTFDNSGAFGNIAVDANVLDLALAGKSTTRRVKSHEDNDVTFVIALPVRRDSDIAGVLEVGQSQDDVSDPLNLLLIIMGLAYPVTLLGASLGGVFLAGRALSPIDSITRTAQAMSAEDLSQ